MMRPGRPRAACLLLPHLPPTALARRRVGASLGRRHCLLSCFFVALFHFFHRLVVGSSNPPTSPAASPQQELDVSFLALESPIGLLQGQVRQPAAAP
jgi:hypothetical protein